MSSSWAWARVRCGSDVLRITYRSACLLSGQRWSVPHKRDVAVVVVHARGKVGPFWLVLLEHFSLGVVPNVHDVDKTAQIEFLRSELCHDG